MRRKSYKQIFVFLMAFVLSSGAMPAVEAEGHTGDGVFTETHVSATVAETPAESGDSKDGHRCTANIVCTHSFACVISGTCWQLAEWKPVWFSTAVKRLTNRSFGPEPTPPIS